MKLGQMLNGGQARERLPLYSFQLTEAFGQSEMLCRVADLPLFSSSCWLYHSPPDLIGVSLFRINEKQSG